MAAMERSCDYVTTFFGGVNRIPFQKDIGKHGYAFVIYTNSAKSKMVQRKKNIAETIGEGAEEIAEL